MISLRGPGGYVEWFRKGSEEVSGHIKVCLGMDDNGEFLDTREENLV